MNAEHWTLGPLGPLGPSGGAPVDTGEVSANITRKGYTLGRTLGAGRFSQVLHGKHASGAEFAVKVIEQDEDVESLEALRVEVAVLKATDHPNIVRLHEVVRTPSSTYLVMELLRGGELFDTIVEKGCFTEPEAKRVLRQLLSAVAHCHGLGIVHRDLKPENLLYQDKLGTPNAEVLKLADFGLASLLSPDHHLSTACGTPGYVSPEILTASKGHGYGKECDLWSLGVILYILLCGYPPFYDENNNNAVIFKQIKAGAYTFADPYWTDISQEAKDIVRSLLTVDPKKRVTCEGVFESAWMKKDAEAMKLHLPHFADNMKKYNLRRKFKGAVLGIMAKTRLSALFQKESS